MVFIAIEKDKFIQMDRVVSVRLLQIQTGDHASYYWEFVMDNKEKYRTSPFETEESACAWLDNIFAKYEIIKKS